MGYKDLKSPQDSVLLVTGGVGFTGFNLCEATLGMGYRVRCLDSLSTGKQANVDLFSEHPNYIFTKGDITDYGTCLIACAGANYVLHQAAWGSVPRSTEMPLHYEKVDISGTLSMMEATRHCKVSKFVYAPGSSVYGDHPTLPKKEGQEGNALPPYALIKRVDEEYGRLYKKPYNLDTYDLRYFNVSGRRQDPNGAYTAVIPKFIKLLLDNKQPTINGDGRQSRDFIYIDNAIEANLKAYLVPADCVSEAYNIIYGGREYLIDIYYVLSKALNKNTEPLYGPDRAGDIEHSNADISKARKLLNYIPEWDFEKGINAAIEWYTTFL